MKSVLNLILCCGVGCEFIAHFDINFELTLYHQLIFYKFIKLEPQYGSLRQVSGEVIVIIIYLK